MAPAQDMEHNCPAMFSVLKKQGSAQAVGESLLLVELPQPVFYGSKSNIN